MNDIVTCSSPSKIILFGEHSVVYGFPAIVAAISLRSYCQIEPRTDDNVIIDLIDFKTQKKYSNSDFNQEFIEKDKNFSSIISILLVFFKKKEILKSLKNGFTVKIKSDIPIGAGLGSSASIHVSLTNALNNYFDLNLSKEEISNIAYTGEKDVHGTPSGIDNTIVTFGGLLYYQNNEFTRFNIHHPITLIVSNTKIPRNTGDLVSGVRQFYEKDKGKAESLFKKIKSLVNVAKQHLESFYLIGIGKAMKKNQDILNKLGVSNEKINNLVVLAEKNGAYGAKLTGAGGGGCIISLTDENNEKELLAKLNEEVESFKVELDSEGTRIEKTAL